MRDVEMWKRDMGSVEKGGGCSEYREEMKKERVGDERQSEDGEEKYREWG